MLYQSGSLAGCVSIRRNGGQVCNRVDEQHRESYFTHMNNMPENAAPGKKLSPAAKQALEEAAARRKAKAAEDAARPPEKAGPKGAEPTRYGDWERGGIAYDF